MYLDRGKFTLRRQKRSRPGRVALYLALIVLGIYVISQQHQGNVRPMLMATPTATRSAVSFAEEAEAHFSAGRLRRAIESYQKATEAEPANAAYWVKLARLQVYAGDTDAGLESANTAVLVLPEDSGAHAVRAFALDWISPLSARVIAAGALRISGVTLDTGEIYWIEGRPSDGGRNVLVRRDANLHTSDLVSPDVNVRTRVHEYGGPAYIVSSGNAFYVNFADQRVYRLAEFTHPEPSNTPVAITPEGFF